MAYLYEDKELVYEKQMSYLKRRIIFVNAVIFISNFVTTVILILNQMAFIDFLYLVFPIFALNLMISYAILINKDSNEQLYLAMYISIIGTIVVMINIFIHVPNPATYILLYLSIAIISVFQDKKAVGLGYLIILVFGSIINFKYQDDLIINYHNEIINGLMPYLYEGILVIILLVQAVRSIYNDTEIDNLYNQLDNLKEVELKYHKTIYELLTEKNLLETYTESYINDQSRDRIYRYIELFNESFFIKEDLKLKVDRYFELQVHKNPRKVLGKRLGSYQLKKELGYLEDMSTFKLTKFFSLILSMTYKNQKINNIDFIKKYELLFMNPDMPLEIKIIGFILVYEHLRNDKPYMHKLSHEQIVAYLKTNEAKELFDKEILEFFIDNEEIFNSIYNDKSINEDINEDDMDSK